MHDLFLGKGAIPQPDLTVVSGDFSMRGRRFEFALARSWLKDLPQPLVTFPGNHDVPGLNHILDRFFSPFGRYRDYISQIEEPTLHLGDTVALATANSFTPFGLHLDWSRGFVSPFQIHALSAYYDALPEGRLRIFGMHHPVVGSGVKERALVFFADVPGEEFFRDIQDRSSSRRPFPPIENLPFPRSDGFRTKDRRFPGSFQLFHTTQRRTERFPSDQRGTGPKQDRTLAVAR